MKRRESAVGGCQRMTAYILGLMVEVFGLVVLLGGAHGGGAVDERGGPCFGCAGGQAHASGQFQSSLHDPLVVLMTSLRTVEAHCFVEYGQQSGFITGILCVNHRLFQIRAGFGGGRMTVENRVQSVQELLGVKAR